MDILKILGAKDSTGNVPVNVKIALDPSVQKGIKDSTRGFIIGMTILSIGLIVSSKIKR